MPGIFGYGNIAANQDQMFRISEEMGSLVSSHRDRQKFIVDTSISLPFLLGYHSSRQFKTQKGFAKSGSLTIVFDGILFEPSPLPDTTKLLSLYRQHGLNFVTSLRGYFTLAVCDNMTGDLYLYTDHAATRPLYYAVQNKEFYFAGDYLVLSGMLPDVNTTNTHAVSDMLTFGYMIGDKTPKETIQHISAGSLLHWNVHTTKLEIKPYFKVNNTQALSQSYSETRNNLQRLFVQAVERTLRDTNSLFTLSGGLDSRAILSTALKSGVSNPTCLIFGEVASSDVKLALQVASETKAQAIFVSLGKGDYLVDTFTVANQYNGGLVYYNGSAHMLYALQQLNFDRWDMVQTGMSGDMLMGSFLHAADMREPGHNIQTITEKVISQLGQLTWVERLTTDGTAAQQLVYDSVKDSFKGIRLESGMTMSQSLELWNLYNRQQRGMFNSFRMIENFAEYSSPFFDADLYQYTLGIPHQYRLGEAIYVDMLSKLIDPSLWRIPWQKSGLPPSKHKWVNKTGKWFTLWSGRAQELAFQNIARRRTMNPVKVWLRENTRLREFAAEQLLNWDSVPYPLDSNKIQKFAYEVLDGDIGRTQRVQTLLFRLLTLSMWGEKYAE